MLSRGLTVLSKDVPHIRQSNCVVHGPCIVQLAPIESDWTYLHEAVTVE